MLRKWVSHQIATDLTCDVSSGTVNLLELTSKHSMTIRLSFCLSSFWGSVGDLSP